MRIIITTSYSVIWISCIEYCREILKSDGFQSHVSMICVCNYIKTVTCQCILTTAVFSLMFYAWCLVVGRMVNNSRYVANWESPNSFGFIATPLPPSKIAPPPPYMTIIQYIPRPLICTLQNHLPPFQNIPPPHTCTWPSFNMSQVPWFVHHIILCPLPNHPLPHTWPLLVPQVPSSVQQIVIDLH